MEKINQYSLTETTNLFEKHYFLQNEKIKNNDKILNYNNHKIRHSYVVLFVAQKLLTYEKEIFNKQNIKKVEVASLLHDVWRFYQNDLINILSNDEFEHWDFWYELLEEEWIDDLSILFAVKYHNKKNIDWLYLEEDFIKSDEIKKQEILNIVKIVRDADKIQNLEYILFNPIDRLYFKYELNNSYNEKILDDFINWKLLNSNEISTYVEYFLLLANWLYDLNFKTSFRFLKQDWFVDFIVLNLQKVSLDELIISKIKNKLDELIDLNVN